MKVKLQWSPRLSVNDPAIDQQHKGLFTLIGRLVDVHRDRERSPDAMLAVMQALLDYSVAHFQAETAYMMEHDYPGFKEHCEEHLAFTKRLEGFIQAFERGDARLTEEMLSYLSRWWLDHVGKTDMMYAHYVRAHRTSIQRHEELSDDYHL